MGETNAMGVDQRSWNSSTSPAERDHRHMPARAADDYDVNVAPAKF
jgi:hypothetical protein